MTALRPSPIHGLGLFASQFILKNTIIMIVEGHLTENPTIEDSFATNIGPFKCTNNMRYVNLSENPNIDFIDDYIIALRDIEKNEELTALRYKPLTIEESLSKKE